MDLGDAIYVFDYPELWRYDKTSQQVRQITFSHKKPRYVTAFDDLLYVTLGYADAGGGGEVRVLSSDGMPVHGNPWYKKKLPDNSDVAGVDSKNVYVLGYYKESEIKVPMGARLNLV